MDNVTRRWKGKVAWESLRSSQLGTVLFSAPDLLLNQANHPVFNFILRDIEIRDVLSTFVTVIRDWTPISYLGNNSSRVNLHVALRAKGSQPNDVARIIVVPTPKNLSEMSFGKVSTRIGF